MKTRIALFLLGSFLFGLTYSLYSQTYTVPKNYKFETADDYMNAEPSILKCIEYLENTDIETNEDLRTEAINYLLTWLIGTPSFSINNVDLISRISKKNEEMLNIYICGWTKLAIESPVSKDDYIKCSLYGLKSVINYYKNFLGKGIKKDKNIEELIKRNDEGTLEKWIREQI